MEYNENNTPICPVCFEVIGSINQCITPCGHTFCLICMLKCIKRNNSCPCCRTILIENENTDDEESYNGDWEENEENEENEEIEEIEERESDENNDYDDYGSDTTIEDYNTENEPYVEPYEDIYLVSLDKIAEVLKERGYTLLDMLYCFNNPHLNSRLEISSLSSWTAQYKYIQVQNIIHGLDQELLNEELLRESNETKLMIENDTLQIQLPILNDYASLDKIADELDKRGYTHLDILHCISCRIFSKRLRYSSPPSHNKTSLEFYELIDELDEELLS